MSSSSMTERGRFSKRVLAELSKEPNPADVKSRDIYFGKKKETAYYLDGNVVLRELNRIFGPDSWSFEVDDSYDYEAQDRTDPSGQVFKQRMFYARGKLHIYQDGKHVVTRGDAGTNIAESDVPGTLEKAAKGAVTNALKRAALSLGPIFGMNLNSERSSSGQQRQTRQPSGAQQRQERRNPQRPANGRGSTGEILFDPTPTRKPSSQPASVVGAAQNGSTNDAGLPNNLEHVGALMTWANDNFGPIKSDDIVRVARQCGIPELVEVGSVSELQPFLHDERLLSAIASAN